MTSKKSILPLRGKNVETILFQNEGQSFPLKNLLSHHFPHSDGPRELPTNSRQQWGTTEESLSEGRWQEYWVIFQISQNQWHIDRWQDIEHKCVSFQTFLFFLDKSYFSLLAFQLALPWWLAAHKVPWVCFCSNAARPGAVPWFLWSTHTWFFSSFPGYFLVSCRPSLLSLFLPSVTQSPAWFLR